MTAHLKTQIIKFNNGRLFSLGPNIKTILKSKLLKNEFSRRSAVKYAIDNNYVVYNKKLLDESALDDRIARFSLSCTFKFKKITVCDPETILEIRQYKTRPVRKAEELGRGQFVNYFLSDRMPDTVRFKGLNVMNRALVVDKLNGINYFSKIVDLSTMFLRSPQNYLELIGDLSYKYNVDDRFYSAWLCGMIGSTGTLAKHFEEIREIKVINGWLRRFDMDPVIRIKEPVRKFDIFGF